MVVPDLVELDLDSVVDECGTPKSRQHPLQEHQAVITLLPDGEVEFRRVDSWTADSPLGLLYDLHDFPKSPMLMSMMMPVFLVMMLMSVVMMSVFLVMMLMCLMMMSMFFLPEKIFHVMIMILMCLVQNHLKIADIKSGLLHTADLHTKSRHRNRIQYTFQYLFICSEIQKCSHHHISTDSGIAFQIQLIFLLNVFSLPVD